MQREEQVEQAGKLLAYLDARTTAMADGVYQNPVRDYTCPHQFAQERELFFRRSPLLIGLSCLLPMPGTTSLTTIPACRCFWCGNWMDPCAHFLMCVAIEVPVSRMAPAEACAI